MKNRVISLFAILSSIVLSACSNQCVNEIITSKKSPNRLFRVDLHKKNCGATTGYIYEYKLIGKNSEDLIIRFDDGHEFDWPESDISLSDVKWIRNNTVLLNFSVKIRIFDMIKNKKNIEILYNLKEGSKSI